MGTGLLRNSRATIAISMIAALFALTVACGAEATDTADFIATVSQPTAEAEQPPSSPTAEPAATSTPPNAPKLDANGDAAQTETSIASTPSIEPADAVSAPPASKGTEPEVQPAPEPTEPPLINTPVPVANTAPDFTLPSIQGPEYTFSQFRGEKPVAIVFYRAYW